MADAVILAVQPRTGHGTHEARRLRKQGMTPAVVYGHQQATVSVTVSSDELSKAIRHGARVVDLKSGDGVEKALIRDLQWDAIGASILHVDFSRVSADERVTLEVKLELRGTAPGVTAGGVLVQQMHNLEVECPVIAVPESIRVHVGELQLEAAIHVKDLQLPEGVIAKNDPEAIVVQVVPKVAEEEVTTGAAAPGETAEPEVIGRKVAEGEEEPE
ncbi:MAG: 50S ribosomal protein L25 [Gemmataceae bacterium]